MLVDLKINLLRIPVNVFSIPLGASHSLRVLKKCSHCFLNPEQKLGTLSKKALLVPIEVGRLVGRLESVLTIPYNIPSVLIPIHPRVRFWDEPGAEIPRALISTGVLSAPTNIQTGRIPVRRTERWYCLCRGVQRGASCRSEFDVLLPSSKSGSNSVSASIKTRCSP